MLEISLAASSSSLVLFLAAALALAPSTASAAPSYPYENCLVLNVNGSIVLRWNYTSLDGSVVGRLFAEPTEDVLPYEWLGLGIGDIDPMGQFDLIAGHLDCHQGQTFRVDGPKSVVPATLDTTTAISFSYEGDAYELSFSRRLVGTSVETLSWAIGPSEMATCQTLPGHSRAGYGVQVLWARYTWPLNDDECGPPPFGICGNDLVEFPEECDDGNTAAGDCCFKCRNETNCGDGEIKWNCGETCDDGNSAPLDGCSATCRIEAVCGNGRVEQHEGCDDGNLVSGDGCTSSCSVEESCVEGKDVTECARCHLGQCLGCNPRASLNAATGTCVPTSGVTCTLGIYAGLGFCGSCNGTVCATCNEPDILDRVTWTCQSGILEDQCDLGSGLAQCGSCLGPLCVSCNKPATLDPLIGQCIPPATCSDGRLNQGEEAIDCGGPCPVCGAIPVGEHGSAWTCKYPYNITVVEGSYKCVPPPPFNKSCASPTYYDSFHDTCNNPYPTGIGSGVCMKPSVLPPDGTSRCLSPDPREGTCDDGTLNDDEENIDCGGAGVNGCPPCVVCDGSAFVYHGVLGPSCQRRMRMDETCIVTCDPGYMWVNGDLSRVCTRTGLNGTLPICESIVDETAEEEEEGLSSEIMVLIIVGAVGCAVVSAAAVAAYRQWNSGQQAPRQVWHHEMQPTGQQQQQFDEFEGGGYGGGGGGMAPPPGGFGGGGGMGPPIGGSGSVGALPPYHFPSSNYGSVSGSTRSAPSLWNSSVWKEPR